MITFFSNSILLYIFNFVFAYIEVCWLLPLDLPFLRADVRRAWVGFFYTFDSTVAIKMFVIEPHFYSVYYYKIYLCMFWLVLSVFVHVQIDISLIYQIRPTIPYKK